MRDKIVYAIVSVLLLSTLFLGYTVYKLNKRVTITENGIAQIVSFINQAVEQSKQK